MVGSEVYSSEVKKTAVLMEHFRRAIGDLCNNSAAVSCVSCGIICFDGALRRKALSVIGEQSLTCEPGGHLGDTLRTRLSGGAVLTFAAVQHLMQQPVAHSPPCPTLLLRDRGKWRCWGLQQDPITRGAISRRPTSASTCLLF